MLETNEQVGGSTRSVQSQPHSTASEGEKERKKIFIVGGITLGILLFSMLIEKLLKISTIEKYAYNGYKAKITEVTNEQIEEVYSKTLESLKEEDFVIQNNLTTYLKQYSKDLDHTAFIKRKIHEIENMEESALLKQISHFNILLVSNTKTSLVDNILGLNENESKIIEEYDDLSKHKKYSDKCEFINIYDCQYMRFQSYKAGDVKDLAKEIEKRETDDDPNNLIHSIWYYIDADEYLPPELDVIKLLAKLIETRRTNIIIVYENSKDSPHEGRINFIKIKNELKNITNIKFIPNFNEDSEAAGNEENTKFYRKLLAMTFAHIQDVYVGAFSQATLGSLINRFENFSNDIQFDMKTVKNNFNKFSGELARYFHVPVGKHSSKLFLDYYFDRIVKENLKVHSENLTYLICLSTGHGNCTKTDRIYEKIGKYVKAKVKDEPRINAPLHKLIFNKMKKDVINGISNVLEGDKADFTLPINDEIKDKLNQTVGKSVQKVKICFNELGYAF